MPVKRRKKNIYQRVYRTTRSNAKPSRNPTNLFDLPTELLEEILSYLPEISGPALALCSRASLDKLGHYWTKWRPSKRRFITRLPDPEEQVRIFKRGELLRLLHKDSQDTVFCHYCQLLHKPLEDDLSRRPCWTMERCHTKSCFYRPYAWVSWAFQRVHDDFVSPRTAFNNLGVPWVSTRYVNNVLSQRRLQIRYKFFFGRLLLRTQHWLFVSDTCKTFVHEQELKGYDFEICPHEAGNQIARDLEIRYGVLRAARSRGEGVTQNSASSCNSCRTEWQADVKLFPKRRMAAYVLTKWQDFGEMESPYDLTWRAHFSETTRDSPSSPGGLLGFLSATWRGKIKQLFEGWSSDFDFEDGIPKAELKTLVEDFTKLKKQGLRKYPDSY